MPVELFDYEQPAISRELSKPDEKYEHFYGGSNESYGIRFVNADPPCQLVYLLDTDDPLVPNSLPGIRFIPLVHGFQYSANGFEFIYRMVNEKEIEVVAPNPLELTEDFPYPDYPSHFSQTRVSFERIFHCGDRAETALEYQGIFGLDELSATEMKRAVEIARANWHQEIFEDFDWSDEETVQIRGHAPFLQSTPSTTCGSPTCKAEVAGAEVEGAEVAGAEVEGAEVESNSRRNYSDIDVPKPMLKTIAIHQPNEGDETLWGSSEVQLFWQICGRCNCITVNNQCD